MLQQPSSPAEAAVAARSPPTIHQEQAPQVVVAGEHPEELPADDFLADLLPSTDDQWRQSLVPSLWSPAARINRTHEITEAAVWVPAGLAVPLAPALVPQPTRRGSSASDSYTIQAVRVDVTADCPFDQLSIFDTAAPAPARPGPMAA